MIRAIADATRQCCALLFLCVPGCLMAQAQNYSVTEITANGAPINGSTTAVTGLNDLRQYVGYSDVTPRTALLWTTPTTPTPLPPLVANGDSMAFAINNAEQIVGGSGADILHFHAVMWQGSSVMDLGVLTGYRSSTAMAVNASGTAVGSGVSLTAVDIEDNPIGHAQLFSSGTVIDLGTLGGSSSVANGINSSGQISGWSNTPSDTNPPTHATLWTGNVATDLGTLGGVNSFAFAINDAGIVVGQSETAGLNNINQPVSHAAMWKDGVATDLGVLGTGVLSTASAINNSGDIVGASITSPDVTSLINPFHAVLWTHGQIIDLNSKLPAALQSQVLLELAQAIADDGSIIVVAENQAAISQGCCSRTFVLTPVAPLTVSCPAASAHISSAYTSAATASGGVPPYTFSLSGTLPPGLALNDSSGSITGTPTASGAFNFNLRATDSSDGSAPATQACTITVTPQVDFALSAFPGTLNLHAGASGSVTISTTAVDGFSGRVALRASGVPRGATVSLHPASISGARTSTLTINSHGAPAGTYAIVVTGTSGGLTHSANVTLRILR